MTAIGTARDETSADVREVGESQEDVSQVSQEPATAPANAAANTPTVSEMPNVNSSRTDESCGAYIARKWEQLGCTQEIGTSSQGVGRHEKYSESDALELMPTQNPPNQDKMETDSVSEVAFLDSPRLPLKRNLKSMYGPSEAKIKNLCVKVDETRKELSLDDYETGRSFNLRRVFRIR